jgi:hypothetical protein
MIEAIFGLIGGIIKLVFGLIGSLVGLVLGCAGCLVGCIVPLLILGVLALPFILIFRVIF